MQAIVVGSYVINNYNNPWHVDGNVERQDAQLEEAPQASSGLDGVAPLSRSRERDLGSLVLVSPSLVVIVLAGILAYCTKNKISQSVEMVLECPSDEIPLLPQSSVKP